jgi:hypothetical protein
MKALRRKKSRFWRTAPAKALLCGSIQASMLAGLDSLL